jgi:hypothetical protein
VDLAKTWERRVVVFHNAGFSADDAPPLFGLRSLFFLDKLIDQSRHGAAANASRRLGLGAIRISHMPQIERLLGADVIVVIKGELAAFAALKILGHG